MYGRALNMIFQKDSRNSLTLSVLLYVLQQGLNVTLYYCTAQKMKFSIKDFFSKWD